MQGPRGKVEGARVDEGKGTLAGGDGSQLGKADVVADGDSDAAVPGKVDEGELVTRAENVGLVEADLAGYVNVEEVDLAVGSQEGTVRAKGEGGVVVFLGAGVEFGDGAADEEDLVVPGHLAQGVEGGRRGLRFGRRQKDFGVVGEVVGSWNRGLGQLLAEL